MSQGPATQESNLRTAAEGDEVIDKIGLLRALDAIANKESQFTERFYEIFFARRPDTRDLFGLHGIAEREEMMHETLRSLHALCEQEPWLEGNLIALGHSHGEYGVTQDMYPSFVDALIECTREIVGLSLDHAALASLRQATDAIAGVMSKAGEATAP